jgi:anti-sigma B factor antagonist
MDAVGEFFQVKRHGDIAVVIPSPEVESLPESTINTAAQMVVATLKSDPPSHVVVDLDGVRYFGSAFITFLLKCHLPVKHQGGDLVIAGVNSRIRELLRTTNLDTLWALYETRTEALAALT